MTTSDDIFARPPRSARRRTLSTAPTGMVGRQNCAVCGLCAEVLICKECAEQPEASKARVLAWLQANVAQANALLDTWDAVRAPNQAAWDKIQDSRLNDPPFTHIDKCARHVAAGNIYGQLLDAHDRYELALQPLNIERARLEKALEVLGTL